MCVPISHPVFGDRRGRKWEWNLGSFSVPFKAEDTPYDPQLPVLALPSNPSALCWALPGLLRDGSGRSQMGRPIREPRGTWPRGLWAVPTPTLLWECRPAPHVVAPKLLACMPETKWSGEGGPSVSWDAGGAQVCGHLVTTTTARGRASPARVGSCVPHPHRHPRTGLIWKQSPHR